MRTSSLNIFSALLLALLFTPSISSAIESLNNPSFWIKRLEAPDDAVLTPEEIGELNKRILEKTDQMAEVRSMPDEVSKEDLLGWLLYDPVPGPDTAGRRFDSRGRLIKKGFFEKLAANMNLDGVNDTNEVRFGVVVERADIRAFPTDEPVLKRPGRLEFDTFQYSSIYPPEAVALLHKSSDGKWGFFQTGTVRGWIRLDKVVFGDRDVVLETKDRFLVVTGSKVKVYGDRKLKKVVSTVPMGAILYMSGGEGDPKGPFAVRFPRKAKGGEVWGEAYIGRKADVNEGFLPYTGRNIIKQAFKMLGEEYGWGGRNGNRDCSEFIKDLFATMGIKLPRNSRQQALAGDVKARLDDFYTQKELSEAIKSARPGITLLGLKGHIMLYIGDVKGSPFVIHQVFGYMDGRKMKVINKVAVTGLDLGARSKAGPLKNRIKSVTEIIPGPVSADATGI